MQSTTNDRHWPKLSPSAHIVLCVGAVGFAFLLAGLLGVDRPLAEFIHASRIDATSVLSRTLTWLDVLFIKRFSNVALTAGLIVAGAAGCFTRYRAPFAFELLFIGIVQATCDFAALLFKHAAGRLRPHVVMASDAWAHAWHAGGDSFPSGHVAYYWGLLLPAAYLYPRYWPLWLLTPAVVSGLRLGLDDHFLSDIGMSMILAAAACAVWSVLLRRWMGGPAVGRAS